MPCPTAKTLTSPGWPHARVPPIRHARAGWRPGRTRPRSPLPTTLLSHRTERSLGRRDLAGCAGRPPAGEIGQPARQQLHTWRAVQRRVERQVPAGRDDLTQRQPRQRPEIAGACGLLDVEIDLRSPPIWSAMVSSERPGPSMRVASRARNHHTPPRNPSGIRVENVAPDQDVTGRSRIRPSAPPVVDASSRPRVGRVAPALASARPHRCCALAKSALTRPGVFGDGDRLVRGEQRCHKRFEVGVVAVTMFRDRAAEPVQVAA